MWLALLLLLSCDALTRRDAVARGLAAAALPQRWAPTDVGMRSLAFRAREAGPLPFARYPDPALRFAFARPVARFDADLRVVVAKLRDAARARGAEGLAATQCGVDARIVVLGDAVFVNPVVARRSPEADLVPWRERCLALPPDVTVETLRDRSLDVAARSPTHGARVVTRLEGAAARQFAHEFDHLRGILVVDHAFETPASAAYPPLAALEAPYHAARRARAWARELRP